MLAPLYETAFAADVPCGMSVPSHVARVGMATSFLCSAALVMSAFLAAAGMASPTESTLKSSGGTEK